MIITQKESDYLEGYAAALQDVVTALTGMTKNSKSYDPMMIRDGVMHSYAFDLKDGGRHHPLDDYESVEEIKKLLLQEVVEDIKE